MALSPRCAHAVNMGSSWRIKVWDSDKDLNTTRKLGDSQLGIWRTASIRCPRHLRIVSEERTQNNPYQAVDGIRYFGHIPSKANPVREGRLRLGICSRKV